MCPTTWCAGSKGLFLTMTFWSISNSVNTSPSHVAQSCFLLCKAKTPGILKSHFSKTVSLLDVSVTGCWILGLNRKIEAQC